MIIGIGLATHYRKRPRVGLCGTFAPPERLTEDKKCVDCLRCRRQLRVLDPKAVKNLWIIMLSDGEPWNAYFTRKEAFEELASAKEDQKKFNDDLFDGACVVAFMKKGSTS